MKVSISEAARRAGVRRSTIYRKLDAGKLSKETGEDGQPLIDLSELARIYPRAVTARPDTHATPENKAETAALQREIALLRELVDGLKQDKERLTDALDREQEERRRVQALYERERTLAMPAPKEARRSWSLWPWGKKAPEAAG